MGAVRATSMIREAHSKKMLEKVLAPHASVCTAGTHNARTMRGCTTRSLIRMSTSAHCSFSISVSGVSVHASQWCPPLYPGIACVNTLEINGHTAQPYSCILVQTSDKKSHCEELTCRCRTTQAQCLAWLLAPCAWCDAVLLTGHRCRLLRDRNSRPTAPVPTT